MVLTYNPCTSMRMDTSYLISLQQYWSVCSQFFSQISMKFRIFFAAVQLPLHLAVWQQYGTADCLQPESASLWTSCWGCTSLFNTGVSASWQQAWMHRYGCLYRGEPQQRLAYKQDTIRDLDENLQCNKDSWYVAPFCAKIIKLFTEKGMKQWSWAKRPWSSRCGTV